MSLKKRGPVPPIIVRFYDCKKLPGSKLDTATVIYKFSGVMKSLRWTCLGLYPTKNNKLMHSNWQRLAKHTPRPAFFNLLGLLSRSSWMAVAHGLGC